MVSYFGACLIANNAEIVMHFSGYDIVGNDASAGHDVLFYGAEKSKNELVFKATHVSYNRWKIPLNFKMVS
jgi:hypothetical protein